MKATPLNNPISANDYKPEDMDIVQFHKDKEIGIYLSDSNSVLILYAPIESRGFSVGESIAYPDISYDYDDSISKYIGQLVIEND